MTQLDPTTAPGGQAGTSTEDEETETMLLLDTTGSMNWPPKRGGHGSRAGLLGEAIAIFVEALAKQDSQAAHEEGGGGVRTVTFSYVNAHDSKTAPQFNAIDQGDFNPKNLFDHPDGLGGTIAGKWNQIAWEGETYIMPGYVKLRSVFREEFGGEPGAPGTPKVLVLAPTDGEALDTDEFAAALTHDCSARFTVCLLIMGFGDEHDRALRAYQAVAQHNPFVTVTSFDSVTDPQAIADAMVASAN